MVKRAKTFFVNGCILTATGLLMRTISMSFQVYLGKRLGSVGMGLFTLILSAYGFCVTVANSGIQLATVRLVSWAEANENGAERDGALRRCLTYSLFFGVGTGIALFFLAPVVGSVFLEDLRTVRSLRVLALGLPFVSLSACMGGYFHAVRRVRKNAVLQVAEQGIYMGLTSSFLYFLLPKGMEYACLAVVMGSCLSDILSALVLMAELWWDRRHYPLPYGPLPQKQTQRLLSIALPVAVSSYARSALLTIEHILIPKGLRRHGSQTSAALSAYGMLHGMALPVVLFGQSFLVSFAALLIPELSGAQEKGDWQRILRMVRKAFHATLPFTVAVSVFLSCFADSIGNILYSDPEVARYIRLLSPLILVMYLDTVTDSMLKGLGEQLYSMRVNLADASISVFLVWLLLPRYGLEAYFFILYFCEIFNTACSVSRLMQMTQAKLFSFSRAFSLLLSAVGAAAVGGLLKHLLPFSQNGVWSLVICGVLFLLGYGAFLWGLGFFSLPKKESIRKSLQKGENIA